MEEWRVINGFPNYCVSNFGNVMNNTTKRTMKLVVKSGYYSVTILKRNFKVHRLVALNFILNPENKPDVYHKDKNKLNNNVCNLIWMTKTEINKAKSIGMIYKSNKNKKIVRMGLNNEILENYNSIEEAGIWAFENKLTHNSHNGRNSIGNCLNGLSNTAYKYKWKYLEIDHLENEEWKEINQNEFLTNDFITDKKYFVSNFGRFKNSFGIIMDNYKINHNGYIRIVINRKTLLLHRLVAFTFLTNTEHKKTVNHIDGNKLNNNVNNLEFATVKEQQIHKVKFGLNNCHKRKIKQYNLLGKFIKEYESIISASKETHISTSSIRSVLINSRKTASSFIWKYSEHTNGVDDLQLSKHNNEIK